MIYISAPGARCYKIDVHKLHSTIIFTRKHASLILDFSFTLNSKYAEKSAMVPEMWKGR